jgi:hypothetical protein
VAGGVVRSVPVPDVADPVVGSAATHTSDHVVASVAAADVTCSVVGAVATPDVGGPVIRPILRDGNAASGYCCRGDGGC